MDVSDSQLTDYRVQLLEAAVEKLENEKMLLIEQQLSQLSLSSPKVKKDVGTMTTPDLDLTSVSHTRM